VVTQTNNTFDITGGTQAGSKLFHSFEQLGLDMNQVANIFSDPNANISDILGRVVGGNASVINGSLQVTGGN
jgi:filamentous hemagglutinin family protein